jgi:hypothetical protein
MHQRDRGNRNAWSLAGCHYFRFEFIRGIAAVCGAL